MRFHPSWIEMQLISQKLKEICLFCILQLQFIDTVLERQPKLRRQRCIFTKERGTNTKAPQTDLFRLNLCFCGEMMLWFVFFVREELSQSSTDEHELCHLGSSDDEHPPSLQLLHHIQLIFLCDPWPGGQQRAPCNWKGASNYHFTAKVWTNHKFISHCHR